MSCRQMLCLTQTEQLTHETLCGWEDSEVVAVTTASCLYGQLMLLTIKVQNINTALFLFVFLG